jgi:hypothetical protein
VHIVGDVHYPVLGAVRRVVRVRRRISWREYRNILMARVFENVNGGFRNDVIVHGVVVYGLCMFRPRCYG